MRKNEIIVNGETISCDGVSWEYPQTDSEASGATDENVMIRDVLPERVKLFCNFEFIDEQKAAKLLRIRALTECDVTYFDLRTQSVKTRRMYPVADAIKAHILINGNFWCEPFELRFIQTIPDGMEGGDV